MAKACGSSRYVLATGAMVVALLLALPNAVGGIVSFPGPVGSQGFCDLGVAVAAPTADVNTATVFTLGNLIATGDSYGFFTGLPVEPYLSFGSITFSVSDPLSLKFSNAQFGSFASTKIAELSNDFDVGARSFSVQGWFTKGTFGGTLTPNPALSDFTISFSQNSGTGGAISANATLSFNPNQPVPEPTTLTLLAIAAATTARGWFRRRQA